MHNFLRVSCIFTSVFFAYVSVDNKVYYCSGFGDHVHLLVHPAAIGAHLGGGCRLCHSQTSELAPPAVQNPSGGTRARQECR